jgi:hypothetical protein
MPSLDISGKVLQEEVPTQIPDTQITATIWHGNNLFDVLDSPITGIDTPNLIEIPDITNDIFTEENPLSPVYDKLKKYSYFDSSEE